MNDKTKRAYEILETLQSAYYKNQSDFTDFMNDFYESSNEALSDTLKNLGISGWDSNGNIESFSRPMIQPISKYQNKWYYNLYFDMIQEIDKAKHQIWNCPQQDIPIFGTLPDVKFTAHITKQNESDSIILISEGLRNFAFCISKIVSLSFKILEFEYGMDVLSTRKYIKENIKSRQLYGKYAKMHCEYYTRGGCEHLGTDFPSDCYARLSMSMSTAINYFALSHEYAHYFLGHLEQHNTVQKDKWHNELQADYHAIFLTLEVLSKEFNTTYILWGIYLYLKSLETFEIYDLSINDKLRFDNHPPFFFRKKVFMRVLKEIGISKKFIDIKCIDYIIEKLRFQFTSIIIDIESAAKNGEKTPDYFTENLVPKEFQEKIRLNLFLKWWERNYKKIEKMLGAKIKE